MGGGGNEPIKGLIEDSRLRLAKTTGDEIAGGTWRCACTTSADGDYA
jgi:hypothetical protein